MLFQLLSTYSTRYGSAVVEYVARQVGEDGRYTGQRGTFDCRETGHAVLVARRFVGARNVHIFCGDRFVLNWNARADLEDVHNVAIDQATLPLYRYKRRRRFICTSTIITAEADAIAGASASLVEAYRNAFSMPVASALNSALLLRLCWAAIAGAPSTSAIEPEILARSIQTPGRLARPGFCFP